jgi:hypothetical protein
MSLSPALRFRLTAFLIHLCCSCCIAACSISIIYFFWYPGVFAEALGGFHLFFLVVGCDVIMGPTLTFVVFNRKKPNKELFRDCLVIVVLQIAALTYGMHVVAESRPVYAVFTGNRLEVITAIELDQKSFAGLTADTKKYRSLPLTGFRYTSIKIPADKHEQSEVLMSAVFGGHDYSSLLKYYQPWDAAKKDIIQAAKPVENMPGYLLLKADRLMTDDAIKSLGLPKADIGWLLVKHRFGFCTALVNKKTAKVVKYLPFDPMPEVGAPKAKKTVKGEKAKAVEKAKAAEKAKSAEKANLAEKTKPVEKRETSK